MTERRASLRETICIASEAVRFALKNAEKARYNRDMPMFPWEKVTFVISTIKPGELRRRIQIYSSFIYGRWVLDQVFPKYDNPEPFHSTEFEVCLSDNPIQVMGWKEEEELVQEGVEKGLREDWIVVGFEERARERGIDLEWHFAQEPPERQVSFIQELEERSQQGKSLPPPTHSQEAS